MIDMPGVSQGVGLMGLFLQRALFAAPVTLLWTVAALREQMPEAEDPGPR